jgi:hypothetical protein
MYNRRATYRRPSYRRRTTSRRRSYPVVRGVGAYSYRKPSYRRKTYSRSRAVAPSGSRNINLSKYLSPGLSALGGIAGGVLGGPVGAALGSAAGGIAGNVFGKVTGLGAYQIKRNVLYEGAQIPSISNKHRGQGATIIRHREYVADVTSGATGTFTLASYPINPGISNSMEWLAQIAANYEQYQLEGCLFEFRSLSADALNSINTALGVVIMATNYNSSQPNFQSKAEMESYEFAMSCKPSCSMIHPIECDPAQTPMPQQYIRTGALPPNQDIKTYDIGNFQIATSGFQGDHVVCGELWISYQVALYKPRLYSSLGLYENWAHYSVPNTEGTITDTRIFGNTGAYISGFATSSSNFQPDWQTYPLGTGMATTLALPGTAFPESYSITLSWNGADASKACIIPGPGYADLKQLNLFQSDVFSYNLAPRGGSSGLSNCAMSQIYVQTEGSSHPGYITWFYNAATTALPTTPNTLDIFIAQIPNNAN